MSRYDHPHSIAAAGVIGKEILDRLPETDVILVPVGGGGLLAGVAVTAKHIKPEVLIYVCINKGPRFMGSTGTNIK